MIGGPMCSISQMIGQLLGGVGHIANIVVRVMIDVAKGTVDLLIVDRRSCNERQRDNGGSKRVR